jgi:hypothetical protein
LLLGIQYGAFKLVRLFIDQLKSDEVVSKISSDGCFGGNIPVAVAEYADGYGSLTDEQSDSLIRRSA